jgi:N6-adenosine-specific RNA methylase IME4
MPLSNQQVTKPQGDAGMARDLEPSSSSILFQNWSKTVACLDIPRTIEESQVLPGQTTDRRLLSTEPLSAPFPTPEPKNAEAKTLVAGSSPAAQLSELMTRATVQSALAELTKEYSDPLFLPRVTQSLSSEQSAKHEERLYVPERSHCLCGTIQDLRDEFMRTAPKFDLIVMDPPWPNRSAKRKKRKRGGYSTCDGFEQTRELLSLIPVQKHLARKGLVAIWITNSHSVMDMLTRKDGVLAEWGLELAGEWIWLKVTSIGEPVVDPESRWRKPWERLLIAKRKGDPPIDVLHRRVLIGAPDMHSRKPNLRGLFEGILTRGYLGLEVFARNLTAGWWGWGDEVTRFQTESSWVSCSTHTKGDL